MTTYKYSICKPATFGFYKIHEGIHAWAAFYNGFWTVGPRLTKNHSCMITPKPEKVQEWSEWEDE